MPEDEPRKVGLKRKIFKMPCKIHMDLKEMDGFPMPEILPSFCFLLLFPYSFLWEGKKQLITACDGAVRVRFISKYIFDKPSPGCKHFDGR